MSNIRDYHPIQLLLLLLYNNTDINIFDFNSTIDNNNIYIFTYIVYIEWVDLVVFFISMLLIIIIIIEIITS